jgi:hypothetical protein
LERIYMPEVEEVENLDNTIRGGGGFGSTGVKGAPAAADDTAAPRSPTGDTETGA